MILFSHPTGNANVRHAALGLHRAGMLGEFWTCINHHSGGLADRLLPETLTRQLSRRCFPEELQGLMRTYPIFEYGRLAASRAGIERLTRHEKGVLSVDTVYRTLDARVARRLERTPYGITGAYAYEDGALRTFKAAAQRGIPRLYDLPIGYWRAARDILMEEAEREPEWASTLIGNTDSPAKTARKDEELALANTVFVASTFTLKTLASAPTAPARIQVIPYGAPLRAEAAPARPPPDPSAPLRVIFVGSLGQRKGLSYLFKACRSLGSGVHLTVIGTAPLQRCSALSRELQQVRWIPTCPHSQVLAEMAAHDVFVFPSLFEGFGLVLLEAMAMGLPIITTSHTAGPDLIEDGREGFIIPIRSSDAIVEKLELLRHDRQLAIEMGRAAAEKADSFTWSDYGSQLATAVAEACQPATANA